MKRIINHRDFNVFTLEKEIWDIDYHNHNFYEIIIIEKGIGDHRLNDVTFPYKKGDVFFLKPSDTHEFYIKRKTNFIYLKFTDQFINDLFLWNEGAKNKLNLDDLLLKTANHYETFITDSNDQSHFQSLANMLLYEFVNYKSRSFELIFQLFLSLLFLLMRNIVSKTNLSSQLNVDKIDQILSYITIHALDSKKMKIPYLASQFSMSENYISSYVRAKTGLSIQRHIIQIKLKLAEKLLKNSNYNINEIAEKLGFYDASHFNKFFKKYGLVVNSPVTSTTRKE